MILRKYLFVVIVLLLLCACENKTYYFEQVNRLNNSWEAEDAKSFEFPVHEKQEDFTLYIVLRNNNDYQYSNIYLFTELLSPSGESIIDTLEYQLAYPDGKWIGSGMGEVKQNTLVYKEHIQLEDTGTYKVMVKQAMRTPNLQGLDDISLMLEKN